MKYIPDLKELALWEFYAITHKEDDKEFNKWYQNVFLPAVYKELGKELNIFK